jgi:hypothetical protein
MSGVMAKNQCKYLECKMPISYIKWQIYYETVAVAFYGVRTGLHFRQATHTLLQVNSEIENNILYIFKPLPNKKCGFLNYETM